MNVINAKIAGDHYLATSKDIPIAGEMWIDPNRNNGKIGDGKTPMFELPWISFSVDLSKEPPRKYKMDAAVKKFIEKYIDLIEECRFDEVYDMISYHSVEFTRDFTRALLAAEINPKPYLTTVPRCIKDLLLDKVDNIDNILYTEAYTKSEIDTKLDELVEEFTKKMYNAIGIPAQLMNMNVGR